MGHLLSKMINGYNWRWSIIMASTKLKGLPNITMVLMFAYSEHLDFATEEQKSQVKKAVS